MSLVRGAPVIAVIGGGFSGAAFAVHLVKRHGRRSQIIVFEPRAHLGAGLAYGADDPSHRINVPAARMSLYPDNLQSFQNFVETHPSRHSDAYIVAQDGQLYPQRSLFGTYARAEIAPYLESGAIRHQRSSVQSVVRSEEGWRITDDAGSVTVADIVVIATTHPSPQVPSVLRPLKADPKLVADATLKDALAGIGSDESVLIVGNGLTSADVIATLNRQGHKGRILSISRRGLRSRGHPASVQEPFGDFVTRPATRASELLRNIRTALREARSAGFSWHPVIDAVRSQGPEIWQALPIAERRRIVRFARPFWDVHRFRIAPQVEQVVEAALSEGRLEVLAASLREVQATATGFDVVLAVKGKKPLTQHFDRIVVTTGPAHDGILKSQPFLKELHAAGHLSNCPTGLGIACDTSSRAVDENGHPLAFLFIAGPLARGTFGELMGLPQVTEHAVFVADQVAAAISGSFGERAEISITSPFPAGAPAPATAPIVTARLRALS